MNHRSDHDPSSEALPENRGPALDPNAHPNESEPSSTLESGMASPGMTDPVPIPEPEPASPSTPVEQRREHDEWVDDDDADPDRDPGARLRLRLTRTRRGGRGMFPMRRGLVVAGVALTLGVAVVAVVRFSGGEGLGLRSPEMSGRPADARSGPDPWDDVSRDGGTDGVLTDAGDGSVAPTTPDPADLSAAGGAGAPTDPPSVGSDIVGGAPEPGLNPLSPVGPPDDASPILPPATTRTRVTPPSMASPGSAIDLSADDDRASPYARASASPRVRSTDRDEALRLLTRAVRALAAGEYTASLEAGDEAWTLDPTSARVANHMATVHLTLGEWPAAETWCRRALEADNAYAAAWTNLGLAFLRQGRPEDAEEIHRRGAERNPRDWKALAGLAAAQRDLDRHDEAMATYRRAVLVAPQEPALRYNMAVTLERAGRLDEARVEFQRYLRLSGGRNPVREKQVMEWLERHRTP